jgi:hypothetical protein
MEHSMTSESTMRTIIGLTFTFMALSGCRVFGKSVGIDVGTNGRVGGSAELDIVAFMPDQPWSVGAVGRVRAGSPFFDTGFGMGGCGHIDSIHLGICGRVFLLELGSYENRFTIGSGSPQLYLTEVFGISYDPEHDVHRHLLMIRAGTGFDVRPLNDWHGSTPYVNASVGYFF